MDKIDVLGVTMSGWQKEREKEKLIKSRYKTQADYDKDTSKAEANYDEKKRKVERKETKASSDKNSQNWKGNRDKAEYEYAGEIEEGENGRVRGDKEENVLRKVL
ncbi:hypothetical protein SPI_05861 [Niveomyces insectorum RCEF 264]|uniref:Uncharacterized protein n=1 Tax=Niveomyces insectorum RCEF 264 TaxID=1081102 RepID=A0A167SIV0_9HYPO|nr:hypothetical protein SPI_05861 [Niveomyces insectorum RCEF 264]